MRVSSCPTDRRGRGLRLLLAVVVALCAPGAAAADTCLDDAGCRRSYQQANRLYQQGRYEEALRGFLKAYGTVPAPRLLLSIGRTYFRLGDCRATLYYRDFRARAQVLDAATAAKLGTYEAEAATLCAPRPAPPIERAPPPPDPVPPAPAPVPPASPAPAIVAPAVTPPAPPARTIRAPRPRWRIAAGAVGLGLGLVAGGLGISALSVHGDVIDPNSATPLREYDTALVGGLLLGGGVVLAVSGAALLAAPGRRRPPPE